MSGIKFTILPHGFIENDLGWNIGMPNPGSIEEKDPRAEWIRVPSFSVLIKHPEAGWILYDTGSHPEDNQGRRPEEVCKQFPLYAERDEFLDLQLARLDLKPEDISRVIISHMHWDHAGGLTFFSHTEAGQNILVSKADYAYGLVETHRSDAIFGGGGYLKDNFELPGLSFKFIEQDQQLYPGIELITLGGHTPGILGLIVHLDSQTYIFTSDAVYLQENYGPPMVKPGILYDSLGFERSVKKINRLERKYKARVIFAHDNKQFSTLKTVPEFYK